MADLNLRARENGPYVIPGAASYRDETGQPQQTRRRPLALCRCGHSARKPFCDGAHRQSGFSAPPIALKLRPADE